MGRARISRGLDSERSRSSGNRDSVDTACPITFFLLAGDQRRRLDLVNKPKHRSHRTHVLTFDSAFKAKQ